MLVGGVASESADDAVALAGFSHSLEAVCWPVGWCRGCSACCLG